MTITERDAVRPICHAHCIPAPLLENSPCANSLDGKTITDNTLRLGGGTGRRTGLKTPPASAAAQSDSLPLSRFPWEKPLCIDLFCGLGGWADGFLAEGYDVVGFDIERHDYGTGAYPGSLVLQDVLTLHWSQFKDAAVIVASPPCQTYSYMAMPWSRAKQIAAEYRSGVRSVAELNALFNACFRIQREACEAAGRYIPLIVENVRGAIPWVGQSRWHYGSFHLWGDVPALMPITLRRAMKWTTAEQSHKNGEIANPDAPCSERMWKDRVVPRLNDGIKAGDRCVDKDTGKWTTGWNVKNAQDYHAGLKGVPHTPSGHWANPVENGTKCGLDNEHTSWFNDKGPGAKTSTARFSSKSDSRKAASAAIAKIPFPLARHIARCFKPQPCLVEVEC